MSKTISCLMMTHNCKDHLSRSLYTILEQTWPDIEIVISDGGSTDGTLDTIRELDDRLRATKGQYESASGIKNRRLHYVSEPDDGLFDALNKSVRLSTGEYLIVSNDCFTKRDALEQLVRAMENGDYVGAHADLVYADDPSDPLKSAGENGSIRHQIRRYWHMGNSHRLRTGWMPGHPTLLLKREIYDRYGLYRTDYRIAADYEFMVRFLKDKENRLGYVPSVLVRMYYGGESTAHLSDYIDSFKEGYDSLRINGIDPVKAVLITILRTVRVLEQF